jgi:o-succinylbenzoate synthase
LKTKETWFIIIDSGDKRGFGECGILRGLSIDDRPDYKKILEWTCLNINLGLDVLLEKLSEFPSIQFGLEIAFKSLVSQSPFVLFPSAFTSGDESIEINGLIWMGGKAYMKSQIKEKIDDGFRCIKMKIGAIDFDSEIDLLKSIRNEYSKKDIELRVDANGAFSPFEALAKLKRLSEFDLHSIEQPIKHGQWEEMSRLCEDSPLPIALDEELIGAFTRQQKLNLLEVIKPQFIILKPSLIGGFKSSDEWIKLCEASKIKWWVTSALESNIGLNAIAQYTFLKETKMPQGLGTGGLFTNNFTSPLNVKNGTLRYNYRTNWEFNL